ncbi:dual specificity protein kinase kns1 [Podochytrium sp. JEL0797]|nr:dual specificity protein kinase kns1 [Podochytrium sp. JEL0797]
MATTTATSTVPPSDDTAWVGFRAAGLPSLLSPQYPSPPFHLQGAAAPGSSAEKRPAWDTAEPRPKKDTDNLIQSPAALLFELPHFAPESSTLHLHYNNAHYEAPASYQLPALPPHLMPSHQHHQQYRIEPFQPPQTESLTHHHVSYTPKNVAQSPYQPVSKSYSNRSSVNTARNFNDQTQQSWLSAASTGRTTRSQTKRQRMEQHDSVRGNSDYGYSASYYHQPVATHQPHSSQQYTPYSNNVSYHPDPSPQFHQYSLNSPPSTIQQRPKFQPQQQQRINSVASSISLDSHPLLAQHPSYTYPTQNQHNQLPSYSQQQQSPIVHSPSTGIFTPNFSRSAALPIAASPTLHAAYTLTYPPQNGTTNIQHQQQSPLPATPQHSFQNQYHYQPSLPSLSQIQPTYYQQQQQQHQPATQPRRRQPQSHVILPSHAARTENITLIDLTRDSSSPIVSTLSVPATKRRRVEYVPPAPMSVVPALVGHMAPSALVPLADCDDKDGHFIVREGDDLTHRYKIIRLLGQGTFGKVVEAFDRTANCKVAIKIIRSIQKYRDAAKVEIRVLTTLKKNDPRNVKRCIHLVTHFEHRSHTCMVFELLAQSIFDFLKDNSFSPFPVHHIQTFAAQMIESITFMHELRLIHTDLKPENLMLESNECLQRIGNAPKELLRARLRLIDFGSAIFDGDYHSSVVSTRHYRAPEIILGLGWTFPCDMWSIGCILVEFLTGDALFQTHDNLEHLAMMQAALGPLPDHMVQASMHPDKPAAKFFKPNRQLHWPVAATPKASKKFVKGMRTLEQIIPGTDETSRHFLDLVKRLLTFDPKYRITAREALQHPFLRCRI